jgi:diadenosine tetraphosphate (Ap4A) HIT family hydrolase
MSREISCCFCDNLVRGVGGSPWDTPLYSDQSFVITPTKGALVPGWLLVVAKTHLLCGGALPTLELNELQNCVNIAKQMVRERFGEPTIFEHGPCEINSAVGCGIDHLHFHVAPLRFSLRKAVSDLFPDIEWRPIPHLWATQALYRSKIAYGLVEEPDDQMHICCPPRGVRQLFRRAIASQLGIPKQFDYNEYPNLSNVLGTLSGLQTPS